MKKILVKLNVSRTICDHLLNEHHTETHRMGVGVFIIGLGVSISKIHVDFIVIHYFLDGFGYAIHGIGLVPFIERLSRFANGQSAQDETTKTKEDEGEKE